MKTKHVDSHLQAILGSFVFSLCFSWLLVCFKGAFGLLSEQSQAVCAIVFGYCPDRFWIVLGPMLCLMYYRFMWFP